MGETWKGNTKYITKFQELFYLNATIFKIDHDDHDEYITIGFLTTQEQIEKREFHKKVMMNIKENKQKNFDNEKNHRRARGQLS